MADCCAPNTNGSTSEVAQIADCCATPNNQANNQVQQEHPTQLQKECPVCGKKGKKVGIETVKAMLAITLHEIRPASNYLFCRTKDCSVVYFADDGQQTFAEEQLREKVYQKHLDEEEVFVCYCFRHTPGSIRAELLETGQSTVVETVTAGTKTHQCACDTRNPQGSCCLGNVSAAVKRVKQELNAVEVM